MNNKFLKRLIIFLIILLIITSTIIVIIYHQKGSNTDDNEYVELGDDKENNGKSENGGVDGQAFYDIDACMKKYLNAINVKSSQYGGYDENNKYIITVEETDIKQKIYNLLSQNYINENNVTEENVYDYVKTLDKAAVYVPLEADLLENSNMKSFLIHGLIQGADDYKTIDEIFAIVNINIEESNFSIEPINEKYNSVSEIEIEKLEDNITSNEDNEFVMQNIVPEDIPAGYINLYKRLALGSPDKMYEMLDQEYREARFGDVKAFKQYVENNRLKIELMRLERYKVTTYDDYVQYICMDQNGKYYIFNQNEVLQDYTVMLDTYTKELQEFVEKYNSSQEEGKVALNIQKMQEAMQEGDYKYVYNKLDNTFRTTKFATLADFEKYIKEKYNPNYTINYKTYQKIQDVSVFDLEFTDGTTISEVQILMQLKDGIDFVISFTSDN